MDFTTILSQKLAEYCIDSWGICAFDALSRRLPCRAAARLPEGAKSVLVLLFPYYTGPHPRRNLSYYTLGPDYHRVAGDILGDISSHLAGQLPPYAFVPFIDSSPIPEVEAAVRAGLGRRGQNGLLLTPKYGSFVFIGEIVTDLDLSPTGIPGGDCSGCGLCVAACPAGALGSGGPNRERCLSHITQKKGELAPGQAELVRQGGLIWGCDRCALVCPYNRQPAATPIAAFAQDVVAVADADNLDFLVETRACGWRGKAVLERNLRLLEQAGDKDHGKSRPSVSKNGQAAKNRRG